ncbi:MAG: hypothetical protein CVV18_03840 [Gammaproteobacteria bacterium HGW-Gammaproteobacteria-8]|nr:MAG: hypothetical protein CVV18_03840 [Gammaproteobacteria bacterium HGW-Gammaproteobacteria-8]
MVRQAAAEVVVGDDSAPGRRWVSVLAASAVGLVLAVGAGMLWSLYSVPDAVQRQDGPRPSWEQMLENATAATAWGELAALWPETGSADVLAACSRGVAAGLACQRMRGNWTLLRRLDRPVVLRLAEPIDAHVVAVRVGDSEIILRQTGQDFRAPLAQLEQRWLGDFFIVWPDDGSVRESGDRGPEVADLQRAARRDRIRPWSGAVDGEYSVAFRDWVRAFQSRNGLRADGIAGPVTRLFLGLAEDPGDTGGKPGPDAGAARQPDGEIN